MNLADMVDSSERMYRRWSNNYRRDVTALKRLADNLPAWAEGLEITYLGILGKGVRLNIAGGMATVFTIQQRTRIQLERTVSSYQGTTTFEGIIPWVGKREFHVTVSGDDIRLAPGCKLVEEKTWKQEVRYRVDCPEAAVKEEAGVTVG